jgi:hypothetical protein
MKKFLKPLVPARMRSALWSLLSAIRNNVRFFYYKIFHKKTFHFNGIDCQYFFRKYNTTFLNERAIEIPIIAHYVKKYQHKRILEIGNVLKHYFNFNFDVVDKYEKYEDVTNVDIVDYNPHEKYDLIVSISTFEHIGYDENTRYGTPGENNVQLSCLLKAMEKTKALLKPGGMFVFTVPLGFNSFLDSRIEKNELNMTELYFLKRLNARNDWMQADYSEVKAFRYGNPYTCANAVMIGIYRNQE